MGLWNFSLRLQKKHWESDSFAEGTAQKNGPVGYN